jgi:hypothetical protein
MSSLGRPCYLRRSFFLIPNIGSPTIGQDLVALLKSRIEEKVRLGREIAHTDEKSNHQEYAIFYQLELPPVSISFQDTGQDFYNLARTINGIT